MKFSIRVIPHFPFWFKLYKRIRKPKKLKENDKEQKNMDYEISYQNLNVRNNLYQEDDWIMNEN